MKKSILSLGNTLNKTEQKQIKGGYIKATCEDLNWNPNTCEQCSLNPESTCWLERGYRECC